MEINALAAQYFNSSYVPLSSSPEHSSAVSPGISSGESGAFAEILKKAQASKSAQSGEAASQVSKKTEIDKTDKLYEACMELEIFLMKNLVKGMRNTVQKSKLVDTGFAGEIYEDMLYDEYTKSFARNANLGFAEMAYRELSGMGQR